MNELPPELALKIAGHCRFAEVRKLSMLNRHWNEVIESNWNSLEKLRVEHIMWDDEKGVQCSRRVRRFQFRSRESTLKLKIGKGSENVNVGEIFEHGWESDIVKIFEMLPNGTQERWSRPVRVVRPLNADKFLEDLFAPIFRRSNIHRLELNCQKSSTLQLMITFLETFRPTVYELDMTIGWESEANIQHLVAAARIAELVKPKYLKFSVDDWLTAEEVREHFLQKIFHQKFIKLSMSCGFPRKAISNAPSPLGPWPNYPILELSSRKEAALSVSHIIDFIEEWCDNKREIEYYRFESASGTPDVESFMQELRARNLPIAIWYNDEEEYYVIRKDLGVGV